LYKRTLERVSGTPKGPWITLGEPLVMEARGVEQSPAQRDQAEGIR